MIGPHPKFLGRDPRGDERQRQLFGDLIDSCVDFGTRLLGWVLEGERVPAEKVVPALMLRDFLAHLDGASSLIRTGCPEPTQVVLRAALEAYLNLIYVASEDLKQRVACYSLSARHRLISFVHRRDPARDSGGRVAEMIQRDTSGIGKYLSTLKDLPPVDQIRAELSSEPFAEIEKEWHRTKKERRRTPKWYALFRGPENLEHFG